jgi:hypothetical protein
LVVACASYAALAAEAKTVEITILHTNDVHERFDELSRIAQTVRSYKSKHPNTLFVDAGDFFGHTSGRTLLAPMTGGEAMYGTMHRAGYDAIVVGNHEFEVGRKRLMELTKLYPIPVLSTNTAADAGELPEAVVPSLVKEFKGVRLGLIGVGWLGPRDAEHLRATVGREIAKLEERKVDFIIAVTHLGTGVRARRPGDGRKRDVSDYELARMFPEIDFIIGGHQHWGNFTIYPETGEGKPRGTLLVKVKDFGERLGVLELSVDAESKALRDVRTKRFQMDPDYVPPDPKTAEFIRTLYRKHLPEWAVVRFAEARPFAETGAWYADFVRRAAGADLAIVPRHDLNTYGFSNSPSSSSYDLGEGLAASRLVIFTNRHLVRARIRGSELRKYLGSPAVRRRLRPPSGGGPSLYSAGLRAPGPKERASDAAEPDAERIYTVVVPWPLDGFLQSDQELNKPGYRQYGESLPAAPAVDEIEPLPGVKVESAEVLPETTWDLLRKAKEAGRMKVPGAR